uniref:Uncharacterized protein n=1 Tax=Onchocerca volvulus TaxID=6282 RepID=A0A8R1TNT1_ONCVO
MPIVGERSKFSCLKIYDDTSSSSDENGTKLMDKATLRQSKNHGNQKKPDTYKSDNDGFIVHSISQKRKNKGKKAKKTSVVVEDGFIVQDGNEDYLEKKYREDLQQAIENSRKMTSTASTDCVQETAQSNVHKESPIEQESVRTEDPVEMLMSEVDSQASALFTKSDGPQKTKEQHLVALYRSKLVETLRRMMLENEAKLNAESEVTKYKMNEKAHMAADLEKARTVEKELSAEIGELRGELMQARSKIRELEMKYKELASKQQH